MREVKVMQAMGATVVVTNVCGAASLGTICLDGGHVLPQLRT